MIPPLTKHETPRGRAPRPTNFGGVELGFRIPHLTPPRAGAGAAARKPAIRPNGCFCRVRHPLGATGQGVATLWAPYFRLALDCLFAPFSHASNALNSWGGADHASGAATKTQVADRSSDPIPPHQDPKASETRAIEPAAARGHPGAEQLSPASSKRCVQPP